MASDLPLFSQELSTRTVPSACVGPVSKGRHDTPSTPGSRTLSVYWALMHLHPAVKGASVPAT